MSYEKLGTGATTVGIRVKDAVILASEKRVSYGGFVMSKAGKKVYVFRNRYGIAFAGLFADIQTLARVMNVQLHQYELENGRPLSVKGAAKLLSVILYQYKYSPFLSEVIVGGIDEDGAHMIVMDSLGSLIEDDYAAVGSGAPIAIGIIESKYDKEMSPEDAEALAVEAIRAAIKRDVASGDGIDVAVITPEGASEKTYPVA